MSGQLIRSKNAVLEAVLKRYFFSVSGKLAQKTLGSDGSAIFAGITGINPSPTLIKRLSQVLPVACEQKLRIYQRKIDKLEQLKADLKNNLQSDKNQLEALLKQSKKGKKIKPEIEEFDLKFKTNPKNQL